MTNLELFTKELTDYGAFEEHINEHSLKFTKLLKANVPFDMAFGISNFIMSAYANHFNVKFASRDDDTATANMICFILGKSGGQKTSSIDYLKKILSPGEDEIQKQRQEARDSAAEMAKELSEGLEVDMPAFNTKVLPLKAGVSTYEGLVRSINECKNDGIGMMHLVVDEVVNEIASNPNFITNVKLVAEIFDSGNVDAKILKSIENQSDEITGMAMSALFIGSEVGILENPAILKSFEGEFNSKLGRRVFFIYPEFNYEEPIYNSVDEKFKVAEDFEANRREIGTELKTIVSKLCKDNKLKDFNILDISPEAKRLWYTYQDWCAMKAELIDEAADILKREQEGRHWKCMKLSAVYAWWKGKEIIDVEDVLEGIYAGEKISSHLEKFYKLSNAQPHEKLFHHFMNGGSTLTVHNLMTRKWIKNFGQIASIAVLANSMIEDECGIIEVEATKDRVGFNKFKSLGVDDERAVSALMFSGIQGYKSVDQMVEEGTELSEAIKSNKQRRAGLCSDGFSNVIVSWDRLTAALGKDCAFSPFHFRDGHRGKDNITNGATWCWIDMDNTDISIYEMADNLADIKCALALTSDKTNIYKYRILVQFDTEVILDSTDWKTFMKIVASEIGAEDYDDLPQSQIIFGYDGREIIHTDGEPMAVKQLMRVTSGTSNKQKKADKRERDRVWEEREIVFSFAYGAVSGKGWHTAMFRVMAMAHDMGYTIEENEELCWDIAKENPVKGYERWMNGTLDAQRRAPKFYGVKEY